MIDRTMSSEQARQHWSELLDSMLAGETVSIVRHNRPIAVMISPKLWEQMLVDWERLDEAESFLAYYRNQERKRRGHKNKVITQEEIGEWATEDESVST